MRVELLVAALFTASTALAGPPDLSIDGGRERNGVPPSVLREGDPFRQLDEVLPTPNDQRTASGAPGARYWQQKADHDIEVELDHAARELRGRQKVRYTNNSPDELRYLWMQLDQNRFRRDSLGKRAEPAPDLGAGVEARTLRQLVEQAEWDGGYRDVVVTDLAGKPLRTMTVDTMMRIDLDAPLAPGAAFEFRVSWRFAVLKNTTSRARS
ncbi:MAG: hypothetical protein ACO3QC_14390, partial [Phycisphaerales bacterium]